MIGGKLTNILKPGNPWKPKSTKRAKYGNKRFHTKDGWFDSKGEWNRWIWLKHCEKLGQIQGLCRQTPFELKVAGELVCTYFADFDYYIGDTYFVEDFKGHIITDVFKLKAKLMKIIYKIFVIIVKSPTAAPGQMKDACKVDNPVS